MDRNHDGSINNGSELFGDSTVMTNGQKARDGYEALAELDTNYDGLISNEDINFSNLKIWTDTNSNGSSDTGELHALADLGIWNLDLNAVPTQTRDNGNTVGLVSSYQTRDGNTHTMADVWFVAEKDRASATAALSQPILEVEPTPLQMGVASMVDAMAGFGQKHTYQTETVFGGDDASASGPLQSATSGYAVANTSQLVQALRQFDANGNLVSSNGQQDAVASLSPTDTKRLSLAASGQLAVGGT
jgi:hypothetical protein